MSDVQSPELNALCPPTVEHPTFTPPVTDPLLDASPLLGSYDAAGTAVDTAPAQATETVADLFFPSAVRRKGGKQIALLSTAAVGVLALVGLSIGLASARSDVSELKTTVATRDNTIASQDATIKDKDRQLDGLRSNLSSAEAAKSSAQAEADRNGALALRAGSVADDLQTCVSGFAEVASSMLGSYMGMPNERLFDRVMAQCQAATGAARDFSDDLGSGAEFS